MRYGKSFVIILLVCLSSTYTIKAGPDIGSGQQIWNAECTACHTIGDGDRVGPDLQNLAERREMDWLIQFIPNAPGLIREGDALAKEVSDNYPGMMPAMPHLSEADVRNIVAFISEETIAAEARADEPEDDGAFGAVGTKRPMVNTQAQENWTFIRGVFGGFSIIIIAIGLLFSYYIVIVSRH